MCMNMDVEDYCKEIKKAYNDGYAAAKKESKTVVKKEIINLVTSVITTVIVSIAMVKIINH